MIPTLARFVKGGNGATAIEYGLIAALVSVVAVGALTALGTITFPTRSTPCRRAPRPPLRADR